MFRPGDRVIVTDDMRVQIGDRDERFRRLCAAFDIPLKDAK